MGLTTWAEAPDGKIKKSDVTISKNYLSKNSLLRYAIISRYIIVQMSPFISLHVRLLSVALIKERRILVLLKGIMIWLWHILSTNMPTRKLVRNFWDWYPKVQFWHYF